MTSRFHCDLLMQKKLIIPGVKFSFTLIPASNSFSIFTPTTTNYILSIESISIRVRRVNLTTATLLSLEQALQTLPAKYPILRSTVRTTQLLPGQTHLSNYVVYNGQLPRLAIVTTAIVTPANGYNPKDYQIDPYLNLLKAVNKLYSDSGCGLELDDFESECHQILVFDLTPDDSGTLGHFNPKENAVLTFTGKWGPTDLTHATTLIIYLLWDNTNYD